MFQKRKGFSFRMTLAVVDEPEAIRLHPANVAECFSAINVIWLFISDPKHLTPEEQAELELICPSCEIARKSYELTQLFMACQCASHSRTSVVHYSGLVCVVIMGRHGRAHSQERSIALYIIDLEKV